MKIALQVAVVFLISWLGDVISTFLPIPIPGSVIGMILLFILLMIKIIKVEHIKEKIEFLKVHMPMFFIPAGVEIMEKYEFVKGSIVQLLIVCVLSTIITFAVTVYTVKGVIILQNKIKKGSEK